MRLTAFKFAEQEQSEKANQKGHPEQYKKYRLLSGVNVTQLAKVTGAANRVFSVSDFASLLDKEFNIRLCTQLGV